MRITLPRLLGWRGRLASGRFPSPYRLPHLPLPFPLEELKRWTPYPGVYGGRRACLHVTPTPCSAREDRELQLEVEQQQAPRAEVRQRAAAGV